MKNYSFVILDDENQHTQSGGWKRVFDLFLIHKNYVRKESQEIKLSDNSTFIENSEPLEVQFFKPENDNYSAIYERISKEDFQAKKDIYFIDMNWNNADSIKDTNVEEKNLEDISFSQITSGKIPSVLAGLNLLNILPKDNKPKIVFSGSDKTENIRKVFKLLSNRVITDDILIGEMTGGGTNNYIDEVERKVDAYLQSRQIAIINRQTADKIQELNNIVKAWNGNIERADEPLIPDNGTDANPENCWSLRTLFPKQVNRIELGMNVEENKKVIYEVLNELNFRKIYKWLVGDHGGIEGKDMTTLIKEDEGKQIILNRKKALRNLESEPYLKVSDKSKQYYKLFHEIIEKDSLEELAKKVCGNGQDIREAIGANFNGKTNTNIEYTLCKIQSTVNFSHKGLIKTLAINFGVYIGDIYFLYHCIKGNNKHNFSEGKIPENYFPKLNIYVQCDADSNPQMLVISVIVESDNDYYTTIENNNPISQQKTKIDARLNANLSDIELKEQAIEDYACLFSNRYKAKIELQFGKKRLTVIPERGTAINDEEANKTEYVFTIKTF